MKPVRGQYENPLSFFPGLKLDFKSLEVVEPTLRILSSRRYLDRPLWLNADVAVGPGGANVKQQPINGPR
jgi:hypothetical protein